MPRAKKNDDDEVEVTTVDSSMDDGEVEEGPVPWNDSVHDGTLDVKVEGQGTPPPEKPKTREELTAEIEKDLREKWTKEQTTDPVARLAEVLKERQPVITPMPQPVTVQQTPGESEADFEKRLKADFFEDPKKHLDEYARRMIGPIVGQLGSAMQVLARENMLNHPTDGEAFRQYESEVEQIVATRQDRYTNPKVYREAFEMVQTRHIDEIIAKRVKVEMAKEVAGREQVVHDRAFTERPGGGAQRPRAQMVTLTRKEHAEAQKHGLDDETYYRKIHGKW